MSKGFYRYFGLLTFDDYVYVLQHGLTTSKSFSGVRISIASGKMLRPKKGKLPLSKKWDVSDGVTA